MAPDAETLIRDAFTINVDQRAVITNAMLDSIHDATEKANKVDDAWHVEVSKRLDEMRSGAVALIDADEHFARLRASWRRW
ncbi:MAG: addiction module protein [Ancrocorticia sp.]